MRTLVIKAIPTSCTCGGNRAWVLCVAGVQMMLGCCCCTDPEETLLDMLKRVHV